MPIFLFTPPPFPHLKKATRKGLSYKMSSLRIFDLTYTVATKRHAKTWPPLVSAVSDFLTTAQKISRFFGCDEAYRTRSLLSVFVVANILEYVGFLHTPKI